jgi:tetratricopeptide (TPR) repeat protein
LLHFTDFHVGMKGLPEDWPTIEAQLFRDLEYLREIAGPWDLVAFTGDLVFSGRREEFERVQEFLARLWERFRAWDCDPRLLAVPGNHDLARPGPLAPLTLALPAGWGDVKLRQDFWGADCEGYRERVRERFAEYERWWAELCAADAETDRARVPVLAPTATGLLPGDLSTTLVKDGVALGVLGLNTTFLQLSDAMGAGTLAVDRPQIQAACDGDLPAWVKRHDACLLLTHQPPSWLREDAAGILVDHVIDPARPLLHLYGHMHESEQSSRSRNGGPAQRQLQGASLFGVEHWGADWEQRIHGYSACRLEFDGDRTHVHIWPRRMHRPAGGGLRFSADSRYDLLQGREEIEPLEVRRSTAGRAPAPRSAVKLGELGLHIWGEADFSAGLRAASGVVRVAPIEPGEFVDIAVLREGRLPNLQREFEELAHSFDEWLMSGHRKRGEKKIRVLWLVGDAVPHRSKGLLACLSRAGAGGRVVGDAARDLGRAGEALQWCILEARGPVPALIGVELDAQEPEQTWIALRNRLDQARRRSSTGEAEYPLLLAAGSEDQAQAAHEALQKLAEITTIDTRGRHEARPYSETGIARMPEHVFIRGLPMTAQKLFGRDSDLAELRDAWAARRTRVISVVAFGGIGKSALVNEWLREMREHGYEGAQRVFAWSFYSQGTKENLVSADQFVSEALKRLGDEDSVSLNPWAKGIKLASLIKRHRFLLVLDGMEPLQHPPEAPDVGGRLTDDSIWALLEELAKDDWSGLCVITTRVGLSDLHPFEAGGPESRGTVAKLELKNLDDEAGARLLAHLTGRPAELSDLQEVVRKVDGHALAITLLGHYLRDVHGGDLAGLVDLEKLTVSEREGGHARRVMATYAHWLERHERRAELAILYLIGLFDRPAEPEAMEALLADPDLRDFTAELDGVGAEVWNRSVEALRDMGLLNRADPDSPGTLDAHPLVREHFRDELRMEAPEMRSRGNRTLFDFYRATAMEQPKDAKEMQRLYAAVTHGCAAGLQQTVFDEVLMKRVWRDRRTNYSTRRLGLTGADLVALSNYFQNRRWTDLVEGPLSARARVLIRTNAGVRLRQLGRLQDAGECFGAVIGEIDPATASPEELEDASYAAAQSCELLVIAGRLEGPNRDVDTALLSGQRAVEFSDRGEDAYFSMHARSSLAEAHFMLGDSRRAGALFEEAREIEQTRKPSPQFLYSQSLYRYGYYLIEADRAREILEGEQADPEWGANGEDSSLLSKAIRLLILGAARRSLLECGERTPELVTQTEKLLGESIVEFRRAGYPDYIVRGLLERARFYSARHEGHDYKNAMADLGKALIETQRGQMELLYADVLLLRSDCELRFWRRMSEPERAAAGERIATTLVEAAGLIDELGYHRRDGLLHAVREQARACDVIDTVP